ncbi:response regulator [Roseateles sp. DXS20W]|uniref:Response regulator n=1 Tax=Pelomonas lactea TaxID=3299030 RepID=A0ABW7GM36_9BURK
MLVLLIEDDLALGSALHRALLAAGHDALWVRRAADVPPEPGDAGVQAVLLDLGLPDGSGLALLRRWRQAGIGIPVLVITAQGSLHQRLDGLDAGADDYLVKPFEVPELLARLRAVARRSAQQSSDDWPFGALVLQPGRARALLHGEVLALSPREFQLLQALAEAGGQVVPRHQLAQRLEPLGDALQLTALQMHLSNLRRKIGAERIGTLRGVGYWLEALP